LRDLPFEFGDWFGMWDVPDIPITKEKYKGAHQTPDPVPPSMLSEAECTPHPKKVADGQRYIAPVVFLEPIACFCKGHKASRERPHYSFGVTILLFCVPILIQTVVLRPFFIRWVLPVPYGEIRSVHFSNHTLQYFDEITCQDCFRGRSAILT